MLKTIQELQALLCRGRLDAQATRQQPGLHEQEVKTLTLEQCQRAPDRLFCSGVSCGGQRGPGIEEMTNGPPHERCSRSVKD